MDESNPRGYSEKNGKHCDIVVAKRITGMEKTESRVGIHGPTISKDIVMATI